MGLNNRPTRLRHFHLFNSDPTQAQIVRDTADSAG